VGGTTGGPQLAICDEASDLGVIEAVSSDGEGEFLPFWRLYIEQNYRGEWVCVGKFLLRERGGRSHIVHRYPNGLEATLLDGLCAQTVGTTLEGFRDAMTHGSVEERLELLKRFVERSRGALDTANWDGEGYVVHHLKTPTEAFREDVLTGKIFDTSPGSSSLSDSSGGTRLVSTQQITALNPSSRKLLASLAVSKPQSGNTPLKPALPRFFSPYLLTSSRNISPKTTSRTPMERSLWSATAILSSYISFEQSAGRGIFSRSKPSEAACFFTSSRLTPCMLTRLYSSV
jgi:hypothetical protein